MFCLFLSLPAMCVDYVVQITMYAWPLDREKEYVLYILSGLWGVSNSVWQAQMNGESLS